MKTRIPMDSGLSFFGEIAQERMTNMDLKLDCPLRADSSKREKPSSGYRQINASTKQAFNQMRQHTEEFSLELAARLRVLGKSLSLVCPEETGEKGASEWDSYKKIRRQLDCFLDSIDHTGFNWHQAFNLVRQYLQDTLPLELEHCTGAGLCRIELVEAMIDFLSDNGRENEGTGRERVAAFSLRA